MTTITAVSAVLVPTDFSMTRADFAVSFGHALAVLPLHKRFTAKEICNTICPHFTNQKCVAYLKKAVRYGIMKREEISTGVWIDHNGIAREKIQAYYYRI